MNISLPPDDPREAGMTPKSRLYERFPDILPLVSYLCLVWCCAAHYLGRWACRGNNRSGAPWMATSIAMVAIALLVWFWSPWQNLWQMQQLIEQFQQD